MSIMRWVRVSMEGQEGATAVEYAFLASLIALVIILAVELIGISLVDVFESVLDGF